MISAFQANTKIEYKMADEGENFCLDSGYVDHLHIMNRFCCIGTWEFQVEQQRVFWSPETYRLHGLQPATGPVDIKRALSFFPPEDAKRIQDAILMTLRTKASYRFRFRLNRADGGLRIVESFGAPVLGADGRVAKIVGVFRDVTEEVETQNVKQSGQELIVRLVRSLPIPAALLDRELRYIAVSSAWLKEMGLCPDRDVAGQCHLDMDHDLVALQRTMYNHALSGHAIGKAEHPAVRRNGAVQLIDWQLQPWRNRFGEIGGVLEIFCVRPVGAGDAAEARHRPEQAEALSAFKALLINDQASARTLP